MATRWTNNQAHPWAVLRAGFSIPWGGATKPAHGVAIGMGWVAGAMTDDQDTATTTMLADKTRAEIIAELHKALAEAKALGDHLRRQHP